MMNLHQIKIFVAIAEKGSFSAAAETIALTQSTISQHMASLEDEIGVTLFDRQGRGITLTSGGALFLRHARRILGESAALLQAMNSFKGLEQAELVIGASNVPANYLVPPLLATLEQKHPGITLTMLTGDTAEILNMLEGAEIELGVVGSRTPHNEFVYDPLLNDPLVLVVAVSHPWARQKQLSIDDLFNQQLIMREEGSGSGQSLDEALRQAGRNPADLNFAARLGSNEAVLQAVASGYGGAFVSEFSVQHWKQAEQLCRIHIDGLMVERKIWLATMEGRTLSPAADAFVHLLKTHFKNKT
jgi:DNA-binding transcriptional LysR family regulator